jgi:hypothetical protein
MFDQLPKTDAHLLIRLVESGTVSLPYLEKLVASWEEIGPHPALTGRVYAYDCIYWKVQEILKILAVMPDMTWEKISYVWEILSPDPLTAPEVSFEDLGDRISDLVDMGWLVVVVGGLEWYDKDLSQVPRGLGSAWRTKQTIIEYITK